MENFFVGHHGINNDVKENFKYFMEATPDFVDEHVDYFCDNPWAVESRASGLKRRSFMSLALDSHASDLLTWEAWVASMQAAESMFAMAVVGPGETVSRLIHHQTRELAGIDPGSDFGFSKWSDAFFLALTCRDKDRVRELARIPVPVLRAWSESEGGYYNDLTWSWAEALQDFVLDRDSFQENLDEAIQLCGPEHLVVSNPRDIDRLALPAMRVLDRLAARDSAGFNEEMYRALLGFREYYTEDHGEDERPGRHLESAVPLNLFALACVAYDLHQVEPSFEPDLSSTYFPRKILERAWENEFPYRAHIPEAVDPQALRERFGVHRPADSDAEPMVERHEATPPLRPQVPDLPVDVVDRLVEEAEQDSARLPEVRVRLRELALTSVAEDPVGAEALTWDPWATWGQVSEVFLAASLASPGTSIERRVLRRDRVFAPIDLGPGVDVRTWLEGFYVALTCRMEWVVPLLAQIPVGELREAGERNGVVEDEFVYAWVEALQKFLVDRDESLERLGEAMRLARPEHASQWGAYELDSLAVPPMTVLLRLAENDTGGFDEAMREGLELFREYYTAGEDRRSSLEGVLPLGLFAIASLAYDRRRELGRFAPDLSSTYFPKYILDRTWEVESPL